MRDQTRAGFGSIPITAVSPVLDGGLYPARAIAGEELCLTATAFTEGPERLGVSAVLFGPNDTPPQRITMSPGKTGSDSWHGRVLPDVPGRWEFAIEAWVNPFSTWVHEVRIRIDADIDTEATLAEGAGLFALAADEPGHDQADRETLLHLAQIVGDRRINPVERFAAGTSSALESIFSRTPLRRMLTSSPRYPILVERRAAGYGAWYEFFPRSEGAVYDAEEKAYTSGNFRTAARRLDAVARMGFDVVLLPPIHPIGRSHRSGPNTSPVAGPHDPGSPWAVGSADGGHDSFHPDLGGETDFAMFLGRARELGLAVALDLALQTSPDHPWVSGHPEWFSTRPDGSIAQAWEQPGVYQLNFAQDPEGLLDEVLRIVRLWIGRGVSIFRMDNAHTKSLWFFQQLIGRISAEHPETVFLADAPASPAVLQALGRAGFQQASGNFSSWNTRAELEANFSMTAAEPGSAIRQNYFVSTPDELSDYIQLGGVPGAKVRAVLAAMGSPLWGMYSGYELYEDAARPGSTEHLDSEKYEYKPRDFAAALSFDRSLAPYVSLLNQIRRDHPSLSMQRQLTIQGSDHDAVMIFSKTHHDPGTGATDSVIVVVNLDAHATHESTVLLDLRALGMESDDADTQRRFTVRDLISGRQWQWGRQNRVRLDPLIEPALVLHVRDMAAMSVE